MVVRTSLGQKVVRRFTMIASLLDRILFAAAVESLAAFCWLSTAHAGEPPPHKVKTVAIISTLGDVMFLERTGWSRSQLDQIPIPDWDLDQRIVRSLSGLLASRFQVHQFVSTTTAALTTCTDLDSCAAHLPRTSDVDAYVLISKRLSQGFGGAGQGWVGIGLWHYSNLFDATKALVHVGYTLSVIDANDGHIIDTTEDYLPETVFGGEHAHAVQEVAISPWPDDPAQFNNEQRGQVRETVVRLIELSLPFTVGRLRFEAQ